MEKKQNSLVDSEYLLKKFPGKGGWTYAEIPEINQNKENPFGWVTVKGSIDGFEIKQHKLMPMGNGKLFLPVRADIRKSIQKEAGDWVNILLYEDKSHLEIPEEIVSCFLNEPRAIFDTYLSFTEGEKKAYLDWIYSAKSEETKTKRIVKMMERLELNLKFHDKIVVD